MQTEENVPETALELAAAEPANRPEVYRLLLESNIFVLGSSGQLGEGEGAVTLAADTKIEIQHWEKPDGSTAIPFFTSLQALQLAIQDDAPYIALPARTFLEMTRGAQLVLNPASAYGKEFTPQEVEALLAEGVNQLPEQRVVQTATTVQLGQPADYPHAMVTSLSKLFSAHQNVRAAYPALMFDATVDEKPHLIVGIEADGGYETAVREAGIVAAESSTRGEPIDLIRVRRGEPGIAQYFIEETKPFYERASNPPASKLRSLFDFGRK
ncbi:MAG: hypothetical protein QOE77_497 [Blastocatellia bacterium]|jgi:hypothetical protein|nr:hypothetical protein [Blastocatellia bacterium]